MREAIGGAWIFGVVIMFIVLFSGYLALSVNYSMAFRAKNGVISIIEDYGGHGAPNDPNSPVQSRISEYLSSVGYFSTGNCPSGLGFGEIHGVQGSQYCVIRCCNNTYGSTQRLPMKYYSVTVFFRLDLPIFRQLFVFPVRGQTRTMSRVERDDCADMELCGYE